MDEFVPRSRELMVAATRFLPKQYNHGTSSRPRPMIKDTTMLSLHVNHVNCQCDDAWLTHFA